jgi:Leucine-rich repeat (LRR) protein
MLWMKLLMALAVPSRWAFWTSIGVCGVAMICGCGEGSSTLESGRRVVKPEYQETVAAAAELGVVARADEVGEVTFVDFYNVQDVAAAMNRVKELPNLKMVNFSSNKNLSDADLEHLAGATHLEELGLHGTQVSDTGLKHLAALENLKVLNLNDTNVGDEGLAHLSGLTGLEQLRLQSTQVSDAGLRHLASLKNLKLIWLSGSLVTANGAAELRQSLPDVDIVNTEIVDTSGQPLLPASAFEDGDG